MDVQQAVTGPETEEVQKPVFTLEEITAEEPLILMDGSITGEGDPNWLERTYLCKTFQSLDPTELNDFENTCRQMVRFLSEDHVYTVFSVLRELQQWLDIVAERTHFYNMRESYWRRKNREKTREPCDQEQVLTSINGLLNTLIKRTRHSLYHPENEAAHETIVQGIEQMEYRLRLKRKNKKEGREDKPWRRHYQDLGGDEQLVGLSLYLSLIERKANCIITRDRNQKELLAAGHALLTDPRNDHIAEQFAEDLEQAPIRVYFGSDEGFVQCIATDNGQSVSKRMHYVPEEVIDRFAQGFVRDYWEVRMARPR